MGQRGSQSRGGNEWSEDALTHIRAPSLPPCFLAVSSSLRSLVSPLLSFSSVRFGHQQGRRSFRVASNHSAGGGNHVSRGGTRGSRWTQSVVLLVLQSTRSAQTEHESLCKTKHDGSESKRHASSSFALLIRRPSLTLASFLLLVCSSSVPPDFLRSSDRPMSSRADGPLFRRSHHGGPMQSHVRCMRTHG